MSADPQLILLAMDGYWDDFDDFQRVIFGAQGVKLEPRKAPRIAQAGTLADRWRQFIKTHNAGFKGKRRR